MLEYNNIIEAAKRRLAISETTTPQVLTEGEVLSLVSDWYQAAQNMYQNDTRAKELTPQLLERRKKFLIDTEQSLKLKKQEMLAFNQYDSVRPIVKGILNRAGLDLDIKGQSYGLLCPSTRKRKVDGGLFTNRSLRSSLSSSQSSAALGKPQGTLLGAKRRGKAMPTLIEAINSIESIMPH